MDEEHFLSATVESSGDAQAVIVRRRAHQGEPEDGAVMARHAIAAGRSVDMRMTFDGGTARVAIRRDLGAWQAVGDAIDVEPLASVHAELFTGLVVGPYAVAGK